MANILPPVEADGKRYYGRWAGDPLGTEENVKQCAAECYNPIGLVRYQCSRPRGQGFKGLFCSQHSRLFDKENRKGR